MDFQSEKRRQTLRVVLADSVMAVAVIFLAWVFVMVVSGYRINADFEVERNGLLQVYSVPRGAIVALDQGKQWLGKTNVSQMVLSGEHHVALTKEGYDKWEKTITVSEGLLYKVSYPRLFKLEREPEKILDMEALKFISLAKSREFLIFQDEDDEYMMVDLNSGTVEKHIDTNKILDFLVDIADKQSTDSKEEILNTVFLRFYNDDYTISLNDGKFLVTKNDEAEPLIAETVSGDFGKLNISQNEDFVWAAKDNQLLVLDMEAMKLNQFSLTSEKFGWLDDYLLYEVVDGALVVCDFDGLNRRVIVDKNVSARFPAVITKNNYLYYFSDGFLLREKLD